MTFQKIWTKVVNWEYWPTWLVYLPITLFYPIFACIGRSFFFFAKVNPNMEAGGLYGASKHKQQSYLPSQFRPKEVLFAIASTPINQLLNTLQSAHISYPFIIKPDFAERGVGVRLIHSLGQLEDYFKKNWVGNFLIQEFIDEQQEFGVFYVKMPNEAKGKVVSIVQKEFLHVIGNGKQTVLELLQSNARALLALDKIKIFYPELMETVPKNDEKVLIEPIGNHNRGTKFIDRNDLINDDVSELFHQICCHLPDFYYGRLDLKVKNENSFKTGADIKIFEVNGANAEPAHMYDPKHGFWYAQSILFKHWVMMAKIAAKNKKASPELVRYSKLRAAFKQRNTFLETLKN